jgi:hypothetical protein
MIYTDSVQLVLLFLSLFLLGPQSSWALVLLYLSIRPNREAGLNLTLLSNNRISIGRNIR